MKPANPAVINSRWGNLTKVAQGIVGGTVASNNTIPRAANANLAAPLAADEGQPKPAIPGNLPTDIRYRVKNDDGSVSTVRTISIGPDKGEVVIPTVINGRVVSNDEAIAHYRKTGENFGTFRTIEDANAFAQALHRQHEQQLSNQRQPYEQRQPQGALGP